MASLASLALSPRGSALSKDPDAAAGMEVLSLSPAASTSAQPQGGSVEAPKATRTHAASASGSSAAAAAAAGGPPGKKLGRRRRLPPRARCGSDGAGSTPAARRVAFVLGGIGSQWEAMGTRLMYFSATFRNTMGRLASHLKHVDPHSPAADLVSLFASGTHAWGRKDFTGIGICAYQIGVINILRDAGVHPDYIVGHSLGETAAGYAAGLQTERETILIQWVRSRMIRKVRTSHHLLRTRRPIDGLEQLFEEGGVPSRGGYFHYYVYDADEFRNSGRFRPGSGDLLFDLRGQMSVVGLSAGVIEAAIQEMGIGQQVCVACENSPTGQTVSGPKAELGKLKLFLESKAAAAASAAGGGGGGGSGTVFWRDVETDGVAYHAPFFSCFYDWLVAEFGKVGVGAGGGHSSSSSSNNGGGGGGGGSGGGSQSHIVGAEIDTVYVTGQSTRPSAYALLRADGTGWISTSSADPENVVLDAAYHARNVVGTVRFTRAIESLPVTTGLDHPATSLDGAPKSIQNVLVVEIGSSKSLLGQVTRTRSDLSVLGLVSVGRKETESIYLDLNKLRLAFWNAGYMGAFGMHSTTPSAVNSRMSFERNVSWSLVEKAKIVMQREVTAAVFEKEAATPAADVVQALQTCIRATKPRPKLVIFALRRAFCCCARDPASHVPTLLPFLRAVSVKDGTAEYGQVAGGIVLLFEQSCVAAAQEK
jgi:malonyl CoA-acyl carrier protein transacylase